MSIISVAQARSYASIAGFWGQALDIIVAIAQAESSLNTSAKHVNVDGSVDRGILQINSRWHPEVADSCAYSAACAFQSGFTISARGTNFTPWASYSNGSYQNFLGGGSSSSIPSSGGKRWYEYQITQSYSPGSHWGIDFATPMDTPFFFPDSGTITNQDFGPWGGEIFLKPDDGGATQLVAHLDNIYTREGQHVRAGEIVGLTGGQTSGGDHPTSPQWSSGAHTHFQLFSGFSGNVASGPDVTPIVDELRANNSLNPEFNELLAHQSDKQIQPIGQTVNNILSDIPGFRGIALALDAAETLPGIIWHSPGTTINVAPNWLPGNQLINNTATAIFAPENYIGAAIRSILDTIASNAIAILFRSLIVGIGLLLIAGLVWNAVKASGLVEDAVSAAKMAAVVA